VRKKDGIYRIGSNANGAINSFDNLNNVVQVLPLHSRPKEVSLDSDKLLGWVLSDSMVKEIYFAPC
jgi:hypothetical protein